MSEYYEIIMNDLKERVYIAEHKADLILKILLERMEESNEKDGGN